jgi:two-component system, NarL family, invasion response regulator UvrY
VIRVALVDDHAVVRTGLRRFLSDHADIEVVGEASDGREALDLLRSTGVDVLMLDIAMPGRNGVDTLAAVRARVAPPAVLIFTGLPAAAFAAPLLRQGAGGYLGKDGDPADIVTAIRALAGGSRHLSAEVAQCLASQSVDGTAAPHADLSARELQVLLRLAAGDSNGHVAEALHLSAKTVSTYRSRLLLKLDLTNNSELTYYALRHGLIA